MSAESGLFSAMGLAFSSPVGVAAGVDHDGGRIGSLDLAGFGHIEIGTVTPESRIAIQNRPKDLRIGINFGSLRQGLDAAVMDDYCAALRAAFPHADYLCANLTSPKGGRDGDSAGVDVLLRLLRDERDHLAERTERRAPPLLIKVGAGDKGDPRPGALAEARARLDGIILVGSDLRRIAEVKDFIGDLTLISVGGIRTAEDVVARMYAGASLVQTYAAFVADGALELRNARFASQ